MGVNWDVDKPLSLADGETVKQNQLLNLYYDLGPNRSLMMLSKHPDANACRNSLEKYSIEGDWQERVRVQYRLDSEKLREELHEAKTDILKDFTLKLTEIVANMETGKANLGTVSRAIKTLFEIFAMHYDQMPTHRSEVYDMSKMTFEGVMAQLNQKSEENSLFAHVSPTNKVEK